ncbi:fungal-specific transcription factor domain-containing protein [Boletus edulis]|nr:fungal-specific transcription factor domain-containing protein [Boletus edulis]
MSQRNSNSSNGSQSPSPESPSGNTSPDLLTASLASRPSDGPDSLNAGSRGTPNKMLLDLPRPTSAGRGGCWKKCDELRENDSCHTCRRLQIDCLGWGPRRPDWMRDKRAVEAYKADIKAKLTRAGLIRGQPRSSIMQANSSSSSSSVFATEQYQGPGNGSTIHPLINDGGTPNLTLIDTTQVQGQGQGESPMMMSMFGDSPFNMNLPPIDPSLPQLISYSPYTPSTSLSSSHPSPQDLGLFDHTFDSVTPPALGFNHEPIALSAHPLQSEHVFYYFDHVVKSLFAFAGNSAGNALYSVVSQNPQGPLANAICALASLHDMRIRVTRGLEPVNSTLENSPAIVFYDTAHAQLYKSREGALTEEDANAALHLLGFSLFSGGVTDWQPMLDIANDWMVQTGIPAHENPKLAIMSMSPAARLALKATMWLDVMSTITLHTIPQHLAFYRRLYRGGGGFWSATLSMSAKEDSDLRVDNLTGCPDEVLLGIAEVSTLSCWKAQEMRKGCLSMKELIRRGNIVESHLRSCDPMYSREPDQTPLHPELPADGDLNLKGMAGIPAVVDTRQLVAKIYREAAVLYLHTVLSEPIPGVPEIIQSIEVITQLVHQLPMSALDRTLVFPICLAGCLTDDPAKREIFKMRLVGQQSVFGNVHQALMVMETAWQRWDTRGGAVEWRDLLHVQGRNLLLLV